MRVFLAGATGVIGRQLVPLLVEAGHTVVGLTRSPGKRDLLRRLGAEPAVADALDADALRDAVAAAAPDAVVNLLTDLAGGDLEANARIRREAGPVLAEAAGGARLVSESISFADPRRAGPADPVGTLERATLATGGVVLRYGHLYGPGTWLDGRPPRQRLVGAATGVWSFAHVDDAASAVVPALERGEGVYEIVDDEPAPLAEWLPVYAAAVGAPPPERVAEPASEHEAYLALEQRGASNARAKAELGWSPRYPSWREGFAAGLSLSAGR